VVRSLALAAIRFSALLFAAALLIAACSATSPVGDAPPPPVLWTYESVSWYNRYSLNSTVGPLVTGRTVIYGGTYSYQNTKASRLAALDPVSGRPTWRMEHAGAFGPLVIQSGIIVVASEDSVLGLDFTSGTQRWDVPFRARTLTAAGPVVLVAERQTIHALDPASGRPRWQVKSGTDPVLAGDTVLFVEGRTLHAAAAATGADRWTLELPSELAYPQSVAGDHLYLLGATALGSVNLSGHRLDWVTPLPSAPTTGIARADDTLYFTTQTPAGSYVFHAFDPATRKDRWSRALDSSSPVAPMVMGNLVATAANSDEQSLVAMARASGAVTWQARAGSVPVQPVVKGGVLYVAGQGPNRVYAFDTATGALLWSGRLFGFPMGMALTEEGALLVSADNLTLYAYRTR
jgi:outer membrane protein assembly factor BamB